MAKVVSLRLVAALASLASLAVIVPGRAHAATVSGEAFGASVVVTGVTVAQIPDVVLPPAGGAASATVVGVSAPGVLTSGTLSVATNGTTTPTTASSDASSTVQTIDLLGGTITATLADARSSSTCGGGTASSSDTGTQLLGVVVDGMAIGANPPPNTIVALPGGIGIVRLNEQITNGDGVTTSELTVNLIHVVLTAGPMTGDVIVGSAHSDVNCAGPLAPTPTATVTPALPCNPVPQPTASTPPSGPIVSGEAFGISAETDMASSGEIAHVVLTPEGGAASVTVLGATVPAAVTSGALTSSTTGATTPTTATAQSSATAEAVDVLGGFITATSIDAESSSSCDGTTASSSGAGAQFTDLVVDGLVLGSITPAPNTMIFVPGIGLVILNEQVASGDGLDSSALTVNMIHVILDAPASGDIIVASAHSDVNCAPAAPPPPPPGTTVSGEAFGAEVLAALVSFGPSPDAFLDDTGGSQQAAALGASVPNLLTAGAMNAMTSGTAGATTASSQSTATVQTVNIANGAVTATLVQAQSNSGCDGATASSNDTGTQFVDLVVNGTPIVGTPAPNTTIVIPSVATVVLNEQVPGGNGTDTSELTVVAIHVTMMTIDNPLAQILVASAESNVDCATAPVPTPTDTPAPTATCTPVPTGTAPTATPTTTATPPATAVTATATPTVTTTATPAPATPTATTTATPAPATPTVTTTATSAPVTPTATTTGTPAPATPTETPTAGTPEPATPTETPTMGTPGPGTPTATPTPGLDHFQCYEVHHGPFPKILGVTLVDVFGSSVVDVRVPKRLCNPADKNDEDPTAPMHPDHLAGYKIKQHGKFATRRDQRIVNQFGTIVADIAKPEQLLVPSAKSLSAPPVPPSNPAVDHFKCYRVRHAKTQMPGIKVDDQFGTLIVNVRKPVRLCLAANKNNEGVIDPNAALACYLVKLQPGTPPTTAPDSVFIGNQFGNQVFGTFRPTELCVPSLLNP